LNPRVAVLAEGAGENVGTMSLYPSPGTELRDEHLGSAHWMLRRIIATKARIPEPAVRFVSPLRLPNGQIARGSMLHYPKNLQ
jgi:hypothetical protein